MPANLGSVCPYRMYRPRVHAGRPRDGDHANRFAGTHHADRRHADPVYAHGNRDAAAESHAIANPHRHQHCGADGYSHTHVYAKAIAVAYPDTPPYPHAHPDTHADAVTHTVAYPNT